jgi:hypothetical protein
MTREQWTLALTLAASSYSVGTIWMVQTGYRLWPYVSPGDFQGLSPGLVVKTHTGRLSGGGRRA